jgi:hypothetical protein
VVEVSVVVDQVEAGNKNGGQLNKSAIVGLL